MKYITSLVLFMTLSTTIQADSLFVMAASKHYTGNPVALNEHNHGLGYAKKINGKMYGAGYYHNSFYKRTFYAQYTIEFNIFGGYFGYGGAIYTGYTAFPVIMPHLSLFIPLVHGAGIQLIHPLVPDPIQVLGISYRVDF